METFDVGIVGAGVHGASAAFHLASRGLSVVIFERWTPAGGPTGRSSAVCRAYYTNTFLAAAARDSIAMMERFQEITGVDAGFRRHRHVVRASSRRRRRRALARRSASTSSGSRPRSSNLIGSSRSTRRSPVTGSAWWRSSAAPDTPIRTLRPKGCSAGRSSSARSVVRASGSCTWSPRRRACR